MTRREKEKKEKKERERERGKVGAADQTIKKKLIRR